MNKPKIEWKVWDTVLFPEGGAWELWFNGLFAGLVTKSLNHYSVYFENGSQTVCTDMRDGGKKLVHYGMRYL
ncbi:MAG TPA: hypothetical protein VIY48_11000 [Candidatus Paceibacterota bacterium]